MEYGSYRDLIENWYSSYLDFTEKLLTTDLEVFEFDMWFSICVFYL